MNQYQLQPTLINLEPQCVLFMLILPNPASVLNQQLTIYQSYQIRQTFILRYYNIMSYSPHHLNLQRRQQSHSSTKRSISTIKNSSLNTQNQNLHSNQINHAKSTSKCASQSFLEIDQAKCANHPNKQALYFGETNQQLSYFCQRCAILLASQGFNVEKIFHQEMPKNHNQSAFHSFQSYDSKNERKKQIQSFLKDVKNLQGCILDKKEDIRQILMSSEEFYGKQIQEINDYFNLIIQSLQLQKNKCYNYILLQRKNAEETTRKMSQTVENIKKELEHIIQDIEESIDAVYEIDQPTYRPVIENYQKKLENYQLMTQNIEIEPVELRKVQFEGVPQSIYSISDVFIKSSVGVKQQPYQNQQLDDEKPSLQYTLQKNGRYPLREISSRTNQNQALDSQNGSMMFSFEAQMSKNLKEEEALRDYLKMWD